MDFYNRSATKTVENTKRCEYFPPLNKVISEKLCRALKADAHRPFVMHCKALHACSFSADRTACWVLSFSLQSLSVAAAECLLLFSDAM